MFNNRSTRRGFAARLAALLPGLGFAGMAATPASAAQGTGTVQKLDGDGKPAGKGFITPLIIHNGLIYIAGQGAHSRGNKSDAGKTPTIEMHTQMVMDGVRPLSKQAAALWTAFFNSRCISRSWITTTA